MATASSRSGGASGAILRAAIAAAALGLSFFVLRQYYRGDCLWLTWTPLSDTEKDSRQIVFLAGFGLLFLLSFVWLGAELLRAPAAMAFPLMNPRLLLAASIVASAIAYATVSVVTWDLNPIPEDSSGEQLRRFFLSLFWPVGLLQETGNYDSMFCGT